MSCWTRRGLREAMNLRPTPIVAVRDADVVYTNLRVSMGEEEETKQQIALMPPYSVTAELFAAAKSDALFMHCLPAHAGEEV